MILNSEVLQKFKDLGIKEDIIQGLLNNILEGDYVIHMIDTQVYLYLKQTAPALNCYNSLRFKTYNGELTTIHIGVDETNYISTFVSIGAISIDIYSKEMPLTLCAAAWEDCSTTEDCCWGMMCKHHAEYSACEVDPLLLLHKPLSDKCSKRSGTTQMECQFGVTLSNDGYQYLHNEEECIWDNNYDLSVCCNPRAASNLRPAYAKLLATHPCYPWCRSRDRLDFSRCPVQPTETMVKEGFPYSFKMDWDYRSKCTKQTTQPDCESPTRYTESGGATCIWRENSCYETQCVGPQRTDNSAATGEYAEGYDTDCADGALATAKAWINACTSYVPQGVNGRSEDFRVKHGDKTQPLFDISYCYKRCPVAVGLAHTESQYSPTAISPDWGALSEFDPSQGIPPKPYSDGSGINYGGGYGLWQLDGRNDHVQKNYVEQIELLFDKKGDWWEQGYGKYPCPLGDNKPPNLCYGHVDGFFTPDRRQTFLTDIVRNYLTPEKQAHWILDQTTGSWGTDSNAPSLPGSNWGMLMTCAQKEAECKWKPKVGKCTSRIAQGEVDEWHKENVDDGSPYNIAESIGVSACQKAMNEITRTNTINPQKSYFDYEHCSFSPDYSPEYPPAPAP